MDELLFHNLPEMEKLTMTIRHEKLVAFDGAWTRMSKMSGLLQLFNNVAKSSGSYYWFFIGTKFSNLTRVCRAGLLLACVGNTTLSPVSLKLKFFSKETRERVVQEK